MHCERLHGELSVRSCAMRHAEAEKAGGGRQARGLTFDKYPSCRNCAQGEKSETIIGATELVRRRGSFGTMVAR